MTLAARRSLPVRLYRRVLSPALPARCKYHPTCSAYAVEAVRRYGVIRGLGARRLAASPLQPVEPWRLRPCRATSASSDRTTAPDS